VKAFHLSIHAGVGAKEVPFLRRHVRAANALLPHLLRDLSIALVNDEVMSNLHLQFMNIAGPTDVLTFPMDETKQSGEIVICLPEARRRAKEQGASLRNELLLYAIHGMLHLCGMDDRTQKGFERMHRMEDEILTKLGIGPVFSSSRSVGRKPARRRSS
jgi:probable rRNA maturation factor